ncbi:MAG: hypothetical protein ACKVW3_00310 [Phycisphaerales bacterium]
MGQSNRDDLGLELLDSLITEVRRRSGATTPYSLIEVKVLPPKGASHQSLLEAVHHLERLRDAHRLGAHLDKTGVAALTENLASENGRRALIAAIAWHVEQEVLEREQRWSNRNAIFLGVAAFALTAIIGFLGYVAKSMVNERLDRFESETTKQIDGLGSELQDKTQKQWIPASVQASVDSYAGSSLVGVVDARVRDKLERETAFFQLANLALTLDIKDGFTSSQRDEVLDLLRRLSKYDDVRSRTGFIEMLERCVQSLAAANQGAAVEEVLRLFPAQCLESYIISSVMVEHYGRKLVGSHVVASEWPVDMVQRFEEFTSALRMRSSSDLGGFMLIKYELLLDAKRNESSGWRSKNGESMWRAVRSMSSQESDERSSMDPRVQFCVSLLLSTDTRYVARSSTAQSTEVARVGNAVLDAYAVEFGLILLDLGDTKLAGVLRVLLEHREGDDQEQTRDLLSRAKARMEAALASASAKELK